MKFSKHRNAIRWVMIAASFAIISLILWNTYVFFQNFKAEERIKMQNWSAAQTDLLKNTNLQSEIGDLPLQILKSNTTTPMILVNQDGSTKHNNINEKKAENPEYIQQLIEQFKKENNPISITYDDEVLATLYYGNSSLLNKLKYYPLALLLIIILFGAVVYFFYRSSKIATQNKLWSGMAKETAHQIGTPLSSLVGWTEILKTEHVNPDYISEIEKDINRLQTITERFSKIGSLPTLERADIVEETIASYDYLKARSSKLIDFDLIAPNEPIYVNLNKQLYSWTIENLVKNAIDAMKGKGKVSVEIEQSNKEVKINISDTGKGLYKNQYNAIFEPGYTTKRRGWGLGLSLAKRIVEDFHNGKIKVLHSEIDKGTTMQIVLHLLP
ncbi:sensor histidine kinase [Mangrovimonas aestuarii]|uniref:sensor histidine kinase n=1 Tax=Mangrovimonas aestuarii TaxID=3018443 RepID=UPI002379DC35|nr:HAMP domain-containing sensor histidine kinase [Mangrovimonas aestuarii]